MEGSHQSGETREQQGVVSIKTTTASIGDPWEVQYARFFKPPPRSTTAGNGAHHPSVVPLANMPKGSWISSFTSLAYLKLLTTTTDHSDTYRSVILTITLVDNVVEEHYISKLHFTWPQVSCVTYSPRGSKVVFMSYKDQVGQIQKFAVRFLTIEETERFTNLLKDIFGLERSDRSTASDISKSKTSSESETIHSFEAENRPTQDLDFITTAAEFSEPMYRPIQDFGQVPPYDSYIQPSHPTVSDNNSLNSNHYSQDVQEKLSAFPPSFTSLLMNCSPAAELASQPTDPEEVSLKKDIMKYLEDSSFQEMLSKVQKVVNEFEDELLV